MSKLTNAQRDLLTAAAQSDTGGVDAQDDAKPTIAALIRRGFLISIPVANGPSRLTVTEAGRAAIGQPTSPSQPPKRKATAEPAAKALAPPKGKIAALVDLLRRPEGATINVMMAATGWQAHSVRGAISGSIKKALGLEVASEKTEAGRVYRITSEAQA